MISSECQKVLKLQSYKVAKLQKGGLYVLSNLQFDSNEYQDFQIRFSHYKCSNSLCANCKFARTKDCKSSQTKDGVTICDSINRTTTLIQGIGFNYKSKAIRKMQDEKGEPQFVGSDIVRELSYFDLRKIGWFRVSIDFSFI